MTAINQKTEKFECPHQRGYLLDIGEKWFGLDREAMDEFLDDESLLEIVTQSCGV